MSTRGKVEQDFRQFMAEHCPELEVTPTLVNGAMLVAEVAGMPKLPIHVFVASECLRPHFILGQYTESDLASLLADPQRLSAVVAPIDFGGTLTEEQQLLAARQAVITRLGELVVARSSS